MDFIQSLFNLADRIMDFVAHLLGVGLTILFLMGLIAVIYVIGKLMVEAMRIE